jgi:hypothetical protein
MKKWEKGNKLMKKEQKEALRRKKLGLLTMKTAVMLLLIIITCKVPSRCERQNTHIQHYVPPGFPHFHQLALLYVNMLCQFILLHLHTL